MTRTPPPPDAPTCFARPHRHFSMLVSVAPMVMACAALACSDGPGAATGSTGAGGGAGGGDGVENVYAFDSRFEAGESAVAYNGQAYRHALIEALSDDIASLTALLDDDSYNPADTQAVFDRMAFYYTHDGSTAADVPVGIVTMPAALQTTFGDYPSDASLNNKVAGQDSVTDYKDWSTQFVGWTDTGMQAAGGDISNPQGLLQAFMWTLAEQLYQRSIDVIANEPGTVVPISVAYVTPAGLDLRQLIQKVALMSVAYSQLCDDYLERDPTQPGKGLLASNAQSEDTPYSTLGHAWDEGFGYWGGARDYVLYTDDEIAAEAGRPDWQGHHDTNGDGAIDLLSERHAGASVNAAKRDRGSIDATDLTLTTISAFYQGRQVILRAGESLTPVELDKLEGHALDAIGATEMAIAATIVRYINLVMAHTEAIDTGAYVFLDHAQHFSEMKGFALGLQFNPNKRISDAQLVELHAALGDAPVLATATMQERLDYLARLTQARSILKTAYDFSTNNVEGW